MTVAVTVALLSSRWSLSHRRGQAVIISSPVPCAWRPPGSWGVGGVGGSVPGRVNVEASGGTSPVHPASLRWGHRSMMGNHLCGIDNDYRTYCAQCWLKTKFTCNLVCVLFKVTHKYWFNPGLNCLFCMLIVKVCIDTVETQWTQYLVPKVTMCSLQSFLISRFKSAISCPSAFLPPWQLPYSSLIVGCFMSLPWHCCHNLLSSLFNGCS